MVIVWINVCAMQPAWSIHGKAVTVNGKEWAEFDAARELVRLSNVAGKVTVMVSY